jgi:hypothetical protein
LILVDIYMSRHRSISINSTDYWIKFLDNHQINLGAIDHLPDELGIRVWFFGPTGFVVDYLDYLTIEAAENALYANDFRKDNTRQYVDLREQGFQWWMPEHPSDRPYSTGNYWVF